MKKLSFLLFIACAIMACSKDDDILIPQESDMTWDEWVAKFKAENGE